MSTKNSSQNRSLQSLVVSVVVVLALLIVGGTHFGWFGGSTTVPNLPGNETGTSDVGSESKEEAQRIVAKVKTHIQIDDSVEPTVATIVDVETLKKRNPFYNRAKNGDHLIVTPDRAILFDMEADIILDVIPVQLEPLEG